MAIAVKLSLRTTRIKHSPVGFIILSHFFPVNKNQILSKFLIYKQIILSLVYILVFGVTCLCHLLRALKLTSSHHHNQSITDLTKQTQSHDDCQPWFSHTTHLGKKWKIRTRICGNENSIFKAKRWKIKKKVTFLQMSAFKWSHFCKVAA